MRLQQNLNEFQVQCSSHFITAWEDKGSRRDEWHSRLYYFLWILISSQCLAILVLDNSERRSEKRRHWSHDGKEKRKSEGHATWLDYSFTIFFSWSLSWSAYFLWFGHLASSYLLKVSHLQLRHDGRRIVVLNIYYYSSWRLLVHSEND